MIIRRKEENIEVSIITNNSLDMDYLFRTVKPMQGRQRQMPLNFNKYKCTYKIIQCR